MTLSGCDVASFQGRINFDLLKDAAFFLIAKATEGVGYTDPTFDRNWTEAGRVGMVRGAYHFARPDLGNTPDEEAAYFLSRLGPLEARDLLALDYEVNFPNPVPWCARWLDIVRDATGMRPLIYLNLSYMGLNWSPVIIGEYPLWVAFYDGSPVTMPWTPWPYITMKQWSSDGHLAGINGRVDLNVVTDQGARTLAAFGGRDMASVSKDTYIAADPTDGKSLEDRVKETERLLWVAEFMPQMRAEIAAGDLSTEQKAVVEAVLNVLENALKPKVAGDSTP